MVAQYHDFASVKMVWRDCSEKFVLANSFSQRGDEVQCSLLVDLRRGKIIEKSLSLSFERFPGFPGALF